MIQMSRFAVYYAPRPGKFADRAAEWLGHGDRTTEARRYGFHGTIRAPFRLADGITQEAVERTVADLAARLGPVTCEGLVLENLEGFLALTPLGSDLGLQKLGAAVVEGTDALRAPLTPAELARRRPESLTPHQRALLDRWGYPYVMDEFRFHLTLTDRLPQEAVTPVMAAAQAHIAPVLPRPFVITDLCLFGEDAGGAFHLLRRYALTG